MEPAVEYTNSKHIDRKSNRGRQFIAAGILSTLALTGCSTIKKHITHPDKSDSNHSKLHLGVGDQLLNDGQVTSLSTTARKAMIVGIKLYADAAKQGSGKCDQKISLKECSQTVAKPTRDTLEFDSIFTAGENSIETDNLQFQTTVMPEGGTIVNLSASGDGWLPAQQFSYEISMSNSTLKSQPITPQFLETFANSTSTRIIDFNDTEWEDVNTGSVTADNILHVDPGEDSEENDAVSKQPFSFASESLEEIADTIDWHI